MAFIQFPNFFGNNLTNLAGGLAEGQKSVQDMRMLAAQPQAQQDIYTQFISGAPNYSQIAGSLAKIGQYGTGADIVKAEQAKKVKEQQDTLSFYENQMNASRIAWQRSIEQLAQMRETYNTSDKNIGGDIVNVQNYANQLADKASQAQKAYFDKAKELGIATGEYETVEFPKQTWTPSTSTGIDGITEDTANSLIAAATNTAYTLADRQANWDKAKTEISKGVKDSNGALAPDLKENKLKELGERPKAPSGPTSEDIAKLRPKEYADAEAIILSNDPWTTAGEKASTSLSLGTLFNILTNSGKKDLRSKLIPKIEAAFNQRVAEVSGESKKLLKKDLDEQLAKLKKKLSLGGDGNKIYEEIQDNGAWYHKEKGTQEWIKGRAPTGAK